MPSLCCFWDPKREYVHDRSLEDRCADCGRPFGYPLTHPPGRVGDFEIVGVIDRGFYGAIYVAERGALRRRSVLKVVPRGVYQAFGKNFAEECRVHDEVAAGTQHLVGIQDAFDADVRFGDESEDLACHVAVLDYVEGVRLDRFVTDATQLTATAIAQIAVDLFRLLGELENKQRFHNDLHGGNLLVRSLPRDERRAEAVDAGIADVKPGAVGVVQAHVADPQVAQLAGAHAGAREDLHHGAPTDAPDWITNAVCDQRPIPIPSSPRVARQPSTTLRFGTGFGLRTETRVPQPIGDLRAAIWRNLCVRWVF